jgi:spoIIIJ-associated protein
MQQKEYIITTLRTILGHLNVEVTDIIVDLDEKTRSSRFIVSTPDSAILIGEHGARLLALNHLMKRIIERSKDESTTSFMIDVNDYQKKRVDDIRAKAHMLAERARYFKSSVEMDPMSSYERMIVHAEFTDTNDIVTESTGAGRDRRVIIRFTETKDDLAKNLVSD